MVRSMTAAGAVPHFHLMDELVLTRLVDLRAALKTDPAMAGGRLTFLPFIMKACTLAVQISVLVTTLTNRAACRVRSQSWTHPN